MTKNWQAFIVANLLSTLTIYIFMFIGMETHQWISAWWFAVIWACWQIFMFAAANQKPRTDRERRPWLYH